MGGNLYNVKFFPEYSNRAGPWGATACCCSTLGRRRNAVVDRRCHPRTSGSRSPSNVQNAVQVSMPTVCAACITCCARREELILKIIHLDRFCAREECCALIFPLTI